MGIAFVNGGAARAAQPNRKPAASAGKRAAFAYVSCAGDASIYQYRIGHDGDLIPLSPPKVAATGSPDSLTLSPDRRHVYTMGDDGCGISQYRIGNDGGLIPLTPAWVSMDYGDTAVMRFVRGKFAYVSCRESGTICQYRIGRGGALTPLNPPSVSTGTPEGYSVVSPDGKYLYAPVDHEIRQFRIGADGALRPLNPRSVSCDGGAYRMALDETGDRAYITVGDKEHSPVSHIQVFERSRGGRLKPFPNQPRIAGVAEQPGPRKGTMYSRRGPGLFQYRVLKNGLLSPMTPAYLLDEIVGDVRFAHVSGNLYAYADVSEPNRVYGFKVLDDGRLSPLTPASIYRYAGPGYQGMYLDPSERYLYVLDDWASVIDILHIEQDGSLESRKQPSHAIGKYPSSMLTVTLPAP